MLNKSGAVELIGFYNSQYRTAKMNDADVAIYRERYTRRLAQFGYSPKSLGWDKGKQHERFDVLAGFVPLHAVSSVLDVGCGFGDLAAYLRARGYHGEYTGIDLVPELVDVGCRIRPQENLRVEDIAALPDDARHDLVVASGIFNACLHHEDQWSHITSTLSRMFSLCRFAVAVDFLTSYVDYRNDDVYYTSPEAVFGFAKSLTKRVALRHDYFPFEFAICLFRDDRIVEPTTFPPLGALTK